MKVGRKMKKWILFGVLILLISGCGSSDSLDKDDLRTILDYSANGYAELMLDTQTSDESEKYYKDKANDLIEGIEENNEKLDGATTDEKTLKDEIKDYNNLVIQALKDFLDNDTDSEASFDSGQKLSEIVDQYFDGELPEKTKELLSYFDNIASDSIDTNENITDTSTSLNSTESEASTSDITVLTENPSSEQISVLDELARTQFNKEFPYKGSKIHSVLGLIQDWTVSGDEWFYKAEATIVNEAGAERKVNVEIHIAPLTEDSGVVTITAY